MGSSQGVAVWVVAATPGDAVLRGDANESADVLPGEELALAFADVTDVTAGAAMEVGAAARDAARSEEPETFPAVRAMPEPMAG